MTGAQAGKRLRFLRQFLRNPGQLGSITPSSRYLTRTLMKHVDFARACRVVELGPGTGVFTRELLRRMPPDGALLTLETNADFVELLRHELIDPRLAVIEASAELIEAQIARLGWEDADVVVSGIPYALLPRPTTAAIVRASWRALADGGLFVGYQYSPYLRPFLRSTFGSCRYELVLRNFPPAFVYVSRKRAVSSRS